jgi:hypothetical protein
MTDNGRRKRPYTPPRLVTYGDLQRLTENRLLGKKADGGGKLKTKTR